MAPQWFDVTPIDREEVRLWVNAFVFTQAVEIPIYVLALTRSLRAGRRPWPLWGRAAAAFSLSLITHPIVWFVMPRLFWSWTRMVIAAETWAVLGEAVLLRVFGVRRALLWSLLANGLSCGLGLLSRHLLGGP